MEQEQFGEGSVAVSVLDPSEAIELVPDGAHLTLTGFSITRNPMAMVHEIIRAQRRKLTLTQGIAGLDADLLAAAGCLVQLNYSGGSLDRFGFLYAVNWEIEQGRLQIEEYSSLALALRQHAAAFGLPFAVTRSMLGSDLLPPLLEAGVAWLMDDPFGTGLVVALRPLRADVAIVHADVADRDGNAVIGGPNWTIREAALSADRVIVQCEEVVARGELDPSHIAIPGIVVDAVVPVPYGAHPTAVFGHYDYDRAVLEEYVTNSSDPSRGAQVFIESYVSGSRDFDGYLRRLGLL